MAHFFINFINSFVSKNKQERLEQFFKKEKNWRKLENEFHSSSIFSELVLQKIDPNEQSSIEIYSILKKMGGEETCYSLIDYLKKEKHEWQLKDKLADSVGFLNETIIYCPNSNLGYFESGHAKDRFILKGTN